jgi:DNA polymerase III subunit chi
MQLQSVDFHFHVPDKLAYIGRLSRKIVRSGALLTITGPQPVLQSIDALLWSLAATEFVAHSDHQSPLHVQSVSPIFLTPQLGGQPHSDVVLNLHDTVPDGVDVFNRSIEVVARDDEADRQAARSRWRYYAGLSIPLVQHDLSQKAL